MISGVNNFFIKADVMCDKVPFLSTLSNIIDLFQKLVVFPLIGNRAIDSSKYFTHVNDKSVFRCVVLLIPVIGQIIVRFLALLEDPMVQITIQRSFQQQSQELRTEPVSTFGETTRDVGRSEKDQNQPSSRVSVEPVPECDMDPRLRSFVNRLRADGTRVTVMELKAIPKSRRRNEEEDSIEEEEPIETVGVWNRFVTNEQLLSQTGSIASLSENSETPQIEATSQIATPDTSSSAEEEKVRQLNNQILLQRALQRKNMKRTGRS